MGRYLVRRLLGAIPLVLAMTALSFAVVRLAPGDALGARLDPRLGTAELERLRQAAGLDDPLPVQYGRWLTGVLRGDLGVSLRHGRPVAALLAERLGPTVALALAAEAVAVAVGVPLGVLAAVRRGTWVDGAVSLLALTALAMPTFFFGTLLLRYLALTWRLFPSGGLVTPGVDLAGGARWLDMVRHLALPALVLGLVGMGPVVRQVRSALVAVLAQDFVRTARAKGLSERAVIYRHALRAALLPLVTLLGLSLPGLVSGAVVTETIFQWPGLGRLGYTAALERDYPVQMGFLLLTGVLTVVGNLAADVLYALADPRVRLG